MNLQRLLCHHAHGILPAGETTGIQLGAQSFILPTLPGSSTKRCHLPPVGLPRGQGPWENSRNRHFRYHYPKRPWPHPSPCPSACPASSQLTPPLSSMSCVLYSSPSFSLLSLNYLSQDRPVSSVPGWEAQHPWTTMPLSSAQLFYLGQIPGHQLQPMALHISGSHRMSTPLVPIPAAGPVHLANMVSSMIHVPVAGMETVMFTPRVLAVREDSHHPPGPLRL